MSAACEGGHGWYAVRVKRALAPWAESGPIRPERTFATHPEDFTVTWTCRRCSAVDQTSGTEYATRTDGAA